MGLVVGALVVGVLFAVERLLFGASWAGAAQRLGFGRPTGRGIAAGAGAALLMLLVIPAFLAGTGASATAHPGWALLVPGLFAQAGIAEESLFRAYLFGHLREGRPFRRAALVAAVPFVAVHLALFLTQPWPIALASVALAAVMSFPLAHLYELGGRTVWAPAILHFVVQGAIKLVVVPGEAGAVLPLVWIAASAALPWLAFLVPRGAGAGDAARAEMRTA
jgi:membrane protease YdiL (CAAX protease family)